MEKSTRKNIVKYIRIILITLLLLIILKGIVVLVILIILSFGISYLVNNFPIRQLGIELVTFIAVLTSIRYGPWASLIITFVLITYHMLAGGFIGTYVFWVIPAYCIAAIIAGFFPIEIIKLGLYFTLGVNASNLIFTAINSPSYLTRYLPYAITNILFNIFIFTLFGNIALVFVR